MATFHENLVQSFTNFKNKYITPIQTALNNKQDKLTNPLTQSDVVDNLNSTSTTVPLSAKQGKVLNDTKASIDLGGSSSNTHLIWSAPSADEKYATPVHWDNTVGYPFIYIDGVKHYLLRRDDIANNLTTNSSLKPLSAAQGYIMSRDIPWYGTSSTAASTIAKIATTSDSKFALTTGAKVSIKFTYDNTASAPTLNVDSTGAKSIKAYGTTVPTNWWEAGDVVTFIYDGTNWIMGATEAQIMQKQQILTVPIKTFVGSGSAANFDVSAYNGHPALVHVNLSGNAYLNITAYIVIGMDLFTSLAGCQAGTSTPLYASLQYLSETGHLLLRSAHWGSNDVTSDSGMRVYIY